MLWRVGRHLCVILGRLSFSTDSPHIVLAAAARQSSGKFDPMSQSKYHGARSETWPKDDPLNLPNVSIT